jgi:hypothetical protein
VTKSSAIDVFCEFGFPYEWENIGNVYACTVKNLTVTVLNENVTNIIGTHEKGKTNSDVHKLNIASSNTCEFLPRGFEKFFPALTGLRIAQAGLVSLTKHDISVFPKLRNCDMFNNRLTILGSDLFEGTPQLDYLYFGDNQLEEIGYDILKPLKNLRKAVFQGNRCIGKNANQRSEIASLQERMNEHCASSVDKEFREKEEENREKEEENRELKDHLNAKNDESDFSSVITLLFIIVLILCGAILGVLFVLKQKRVNSDSDSVTNFIHKYSDMNNEASAPYENVENGVENLDFHDKTVPNVMS